MAKGVSLADLPWQSVGLALKYYRRRLRYTQAELAAECGFSVPYIKKIEAGQIPPAETIQRLISVLQLTSEEANGIMLLGKQRAWKVEG